MYLLHSESWNTTGFFLMFLALLNSFKDYKTEFEIGFYKRMFAITNRHNYDHFQKYRKITQGNNVINIQPKQQIMCKVNT